MPIFISGSAATKYTLNVDGFTGNLRDAHNRNITRDPFLHLMLIMMAILVKTVDFYFAEDGGFVTTFAISLILMGYTTLGVKWESMSTTKTFLLHSQEYTGYHMGSMSWMVEILCYLQK